MPPRLTFEYNLLLHVYPDDELDKDLFVQASGTSPSLHRNVWLYWVNTTFDDGEEVWQVIRLHRHARDSDDAAAAHKYVYPDMLVVDGPCERENNQTFTLVTRCSRDHREAVLECADDVAAAYYQDDGRVMRRRHGGDGEGDDEGQQSARWMGALLECMVEEGLVARGVVDEIRDAVPLP